MGEKTPGSGKLGRLGAVLGKVRAARGVLFIALGVAWMAFFVVMGVNFLTSGDGGEQADEAPRVAPDSAPGAITATRSSWEPGQASLVSYDEYGEATEGATELGALLLRARTALLEAIEEARRRAEERARRRAERLARLAWLREKRRLEREHRRAVRAAERERRRAEREARRECLKAVRAAEEKRKEGAIKPGQECRIPEVQDQFDCETGFPGPRLSASACA